MNCKSCQVFSQVSWETILELSTLLLVQFGTLANPVTITYQSPILMHVSE